MAALDNFVVGQRAAKKTLALVAWKHLTCMKLADMNRSLEESNVLLVGPTGTGKTLLVESLAKILKLPFASVDATTLSQTGYVGGNVPDCVVSLYAAAGQKLAAAERGIVFIDEIDKIKKGAGGSQDVAGVGVQQGFLKLIEGTKVQIASGVVLNTKNILFIGGGAFSEMAVTINRRIAFAGSSIGFLAEPKSPHAPVHNVLKHATIDDFIAYGMLPELMGRFQSMITLDELSVDMLFRILSEPRSALMRQYQVLCRSIGVELVVDKGLLHTIAERAYVRKLGARGLRAVLEEVMEDMLFILPGDKERDATISKVTLDESFLTTKKVRYGRTARIADSGSVPP